MAHQGAGAVAGGLWYRAGGAILCGIMKTWTTLKIRASKGVRKLACLTAGDVTMARLMDAAGVQLVLVGDSLGMTMLGYDTTLPVTMAQMLHHTAAVARGVGEALVVADMPFMTYQVSEEEGVRNAGRFLQEAGADAVKIEGGAFRAPLVRRLVENGIPVLGHIGLTPQMINEMGGFRVQGRSAMQADALVQDGLALAEAGAFAVVLEGVPPSLGKRVTGALPVPVIGIGAGPDCDGQVLVVNDLLGLTEKPPKFAKAYAGLRETVAEAFGKFVAEVEAREFPGTEQCYKE